MGLDRGTTTRQVRCWVAEIASKEPFEEGAQTLESLTGVALSAATLERIAVGVGEELARQQERQAALYQKECLPEPGGWRQGRARRLYAGMDGLMVPLREPWKKDKSLGPLSCRWSECKLGMVYEAYCGKEGDERVRTRAYTATLSEAQRFGPQLATLAHSCGYGFAKERVVIGDGAAWIWRLAGKHFPGALQIVDFSTPASTLPASLR